MQADAQEAARRFATEGIVTPGAIYRKLMATSRGQAVTRSRELALLDS